MKKLIISIVVVFFGCSISYSQASIPTIVFAGKTVKSILSEFEQTAKRLMQDGQTAGDGLAAKFGNEVLVATQNLDYYFGRNSQNIFNNLSIAQQNLFVELNKILSSFNELNSTITTVSELTNLDLIELTNRINLLTNKVRFYVSSIKGTTVIYGDTDYKITMVGIGFGMNDSNQQYETTVSISGHVLGANSIDLTQRRTMSITIPNELVRTKFQEHKIAYLPVVITSQITSRNWLRYTQTDTYETKFNLVLLPAVAGYIIVGETTSEKVLDGHTITQSISRNFQGCKTDSPCEMVEEWSCSLNQKIVDVRYDCSGQCGWSYNKRRGGYSADYDILNDGRTAKVYRHLDGENATLVTYYIDYQNYIDKYTPSSGPVIYLKYDQPLDVTLNEKNDDCNYTIKGKLFTGQIIDYNNNTISSSPYFKLSGIGKVGNSCKATFRLFVPN